MIAGEFTAPSTTYPKIILKVHHVFSSAETKILLGQLFNILRHRIAFLASFGRHVVKMTPTSAHAQRIRPSDKLKLQFYYIVFPFHKFVCLWDE